MDDNRDAADSTALLLRAAGFDARACYDGVSALEMSQIFRPLLCLIDLHMPGMNGDALAIRLRSGAGWKPYRLVAVTAMSDEGSCLRIREAGFDLHLVKPVDSEKLLPLARILCHGPPEHSLDVEDRTDQAG